MKSFEQKQIDEASAEEVREYAASFLGIPTDDLSDDQVRAKIRTATETDLIFVRTKPEKAAQIGAPPPDVGAKTSGGLIGGLGHDDPKVRLTLHAEERDGVVQNRHKEISVNGVVWLVARGKSVEVPYRVFEALNNAKRDNIRHDDEGNVLSQTVHNTPFNVERMPPQEEIAAWEERVKDLEIA